MKTAAFWKTKTNRAGRYVNIGVRFLRRALKARSTIAMKLFCDTFKMLLTTYFGKLTETNMMNSWPQKKKSLLQVPTEFHIVSTDVLEGCLLNS